MKRAAYLAESKGVIPEAIYNAACIFSLAATDMTVTSEDRERRAIQAVKYLSKINDRKYFGSRKKQKEILEDPDLVSLRNREDFKELLEKIIKK